MMTPRQAGRQLGFDDSALLGSVNSGRLSAYNLGDGIRFKATDIAAMQATLTAA